MAQPMGQHDQVRHCQPGLQSSPFIREKVLFKVPSMKPTRKVNRGICTMVSCFPVLDTNTSDF